MPTGSVTIESVDYLQRCLLPPADMGGPGTSGAPETRRLLRVLGIGRPDKEFKRRPTFPDERWRPHTAGLITGLYGYRIPVAFYLVGAGDGVRVQLGTWSAKAGAAGDAQDR